MEPVTVSIIITMGACIASYFWGKYQNNPDAVIQCTLDTLIQDGYLKSKTDENGEEELIKLIKSNIISN